MKQVAQHALERNARYVMLYENELDVLDTLPLWMERLFRVLVQLSVWQTGQGRTTYDQVLAKLQPLQPRSGRRHYAPDAQAVLKAMRLFHACGIVVRNTGWSQRAGALFFEIAPRKAFVRSKAESDTPKRHPPTSLQNQQRRGL